MAHNLRSKKRRNRRNPFDEGLTRQLTSQEVLQEALLRVTKGITLSLSEDAHYGPEGLFSVVLYAAAHKTTIEQATKALVGAPHSNTVRGAITPLGVKELERELNEVLADTLAEGLLSYPLEIAIDLKLIPYHGKALPGEEDFIISGPAKGGTTTFFGYASIYLIKKNKRFTIALAAVRHSEGLKGVLKRLLDRFASLGGRIFCLYVDRGFYSVEVLRFLIEERDIPLAMAAPQKGKEGGIKGLIAREGVGVFPYTVKSRKEGEITVEVAVIGKYFNGRWDKHGRCFYSYIIHRFPFAISSLFDKYRSRFGIESSHRLWDQGRGRTSSRDVSLRYMLVGLAVLLYNTWTLLKWSVVSLPRRGGRLLLHALFTFTRMLFFLAKAIENRLGVVEVVTIPISP